MFTPDSLLNIAITAHAICKNSETAEQRSRAWTLYEHAMACAEWLDNQKVKEMSHVGPFGDVPFKKGQKVRVKQDFMAEVDHPLPDYQLRELYRKNLLNQRATNV